MCAFAGSDGVFPEQELGVKAKALEVARSDDEDKRATKIPVSYSDIADYANSTIGVAGPMLSRLGKCRSLILRQTEGKLDILDEPALIKYKNYFDQ